MMIYILDLGKGYYTEKSQIVCDLDCGKLFVNISERGENGFSFNFRCFGLIMSYIIECLCSIMKDDVSGIQTYN